MASSKRSIRLRSLDGETFEVSEALATKSQWIKQMMEDGSVDTEIQMEFATGKTLAKAIEYCRVHAESDGKHDELNDFDAQFVKVDHLTLAHAFVANELEIKNLVALTSHAAVHLFNELEIKNFVYLTCGALVDLFKGNSEEVLKTFFLNCSLTLEKEEEELSHGGDGGYGDRDGTLGDEGGYGGRSGGSGRYGGNSGVSGGRLSAL